MFILVYHGMPGPEGPREHHGGTVLRSLEVRESWLIKPDSPRMETSPQNMTNVHSSGYPHANTCATVWSLLGFKWLSQGLYPTGKKKERAWYRIVAILKAILGPGVKPICFCSMVANRVGAGFVEPNYCWTIAQGWLFGTIVLLKNNELETVQHGVLGKENTDDVRRTLDYDADMYRRFVQGASNAGIFCAL